MVNYRVGGLEIRGDDEFNSLLKNTLHHWPYWNDATSKRVNPYGDGWRLPTLSELKFISNILFSNETGNFSNAIGYWTGDFDNGPTPLPRVIFYYLSNRHNWTTPSSYYRIRLVRNIR